MMMKKSWLKGYYKKDIKEEQYFIKSADKEIAQLKEARKHEKHWLTRFLLGDALRKAESDRRYYSKSIAYDRKKLKEMM